MSTFGKLKSIWRRSFRPTAADCERLVIYEWYTLCASVQRGDTTGAAISTTLLHDYGIFLQRARLRERGATTAGGRA